MKNDGNFNILSIDGGGIKGLYSAVILSNFEDRYGKISDHFDLICGTSTGGIIALALAANIPAKDIVNLYMIEGPKIFPHSKFGRYQWNSFMQFAFKSKYKENILRRSLEDIFEKKKIGDCGTNVLIPTSNITTGQPFVIKNNHSEGLIRDDEHSLVETALATTAAPTYFPVQEVSTLKDNKHQFIDGGLYANNPALLGIQEAYRYFIKKEQHIYKNYSLLSVSTLHQNFRFEKRIKNPEMSLLKWNKNLITLMMDLQSISTHYHIEYLNNTLKGHYVRIGSEPLNKEENKLIGLDKAGKKSIELLVEKGEIASKSWIDKPEIKKFFT